MGKRFEYSNSHYICDSKNGENYTDDDLMCLADLLNEQDEKINELQAELNSKNNIIWDEKDNAILCGDCYCINNDVGKLVEENKQLKQSQNQSDTIQSLNFFDSKDISSIIKKKEKLIDKYNKLNKKFLKTIECFDNQIVELRGKENE